MLRVPSSFMALVGVAAASLLTSCGKDSPTRPAVDPNAGKHEITVDVHHFRIRGACEGVSTNPGEFRYAVRVLSLGGDTLSFTAGNLTGLPGATTQPASHEFRFIMDPRANQGFLVEARCTEYDNGVADSRMNEYGSDRTHMFLGGTNWSNGLRIIQLGDTACGYEVEYSVSVRVL